MSFVVIYVQPQWIIITSVLTNMEMPVLCNIVQEFVQIPDSIQFILDWNGDLVMFINAFEPDDFRALDDI